MRVVLFLLGTLLFAVEAKAFPVAQDDNVNATGAVTLIDVLANDFDTDGGPLTISMVSSPANGGITEISYDNGRQVISYRPAPWMMGNWTDYFAYWVSDQWGNMIMANVSVMNSSSPPIANPDSVNSVPNQPVRIDALANDFDMEDQISILDFSPAMNGQVQLAWEGNRNVFFYIPSPGFAGTDTFQYRIVDSGGNYATSTVTINVMNTPPAAADDSLSVMVNTIAHIDVLANDIDPDGQVMDIHGVSTPQNGIAVLEIYNGREAVAYQPNSNFVGTDSFAYFGTDGFSPFQATVTVTVTDPVAPALILLTPSNNTYTKAASFQLSANANDNVAIARVDFYVNGSPVGSASVPSNGAYRFNFDTSAFSSHVLAVSAVAWDTSGNMGQSQSANLIVDKIKPNVQMTSPSNNSRPRVGTTITLSASASDNMGVSSVKFLINGATICTDTTAPYSCSWKVPSAIGATYTIYSQAFDAAGNSRNSGTVTIQSKY